MNGNLGNKVSLSETVVFLKSMSSARETVRIKEISKSIETNLTTTLNKIRIPEMLRGIKRYINNDLDYPQVNVYVVDNFSQMSQYLNLNKKRGCNGSW